MILDGGIQFKNILNALEIAEIPGCDHHPEDWIEIVDVDIADSDIPVPECDLCGGEGIPDPEPAVNPWLIHDFVTAIRTGDIRTAQCLVGRVFDLPDDTALVERELFQAAA